jgi:hypothetical protein
VCMVSSRTAVWAEVEGRDVAEGRAARGPVGEHRHGRHVHLAQRESNTDERAQKPARRHNGTGGSKEGHPASNRAVDR